MEAQSSSNLLDEMDRQQNQVIEQLDGLNERILALIAEWQGEERERESQVKQVLAKVSATSVA